eukprot:CAMPEP_0185261456 /NCGR_PEP_ID=MMETSP1359-20130426/9839_1 /TAXON_ID=552665 /ORGANISM="Bigelowiella longifila, Strain CCMP242" /LENGTH=68 /DNA_ID=CAMNT_0027848077 /DNA_START=116 /DNA_END=322 /DNA_ORIENTATION=-
MEVGVAEEGGVLAFEEEAGPEAEEDSEAGAGLSGAEAEVAEAEAAEAELLASARPTSSRWAKSHAGTI